ncbi:UNVERIFIED_CONTAM: hypothetical protein FKN15_040670 [Acipenser sinensis]
MLRSCGLGEIQQVDLLCGVLEGIAKQEVMVLEEEERGTCAQIWRTLDELYGDKAPGVKLRVDFFAARQNRGRFKLGCLATMGQVDGRLDQGGQSIEEPMLLGECLGVEVQIRGVQMPCLLDTGSQVTLFSKSFFERWLGQESVRGATDISWLKLLAANGLQIPYIGYVVLDFVIGGVKVPDRGVVIVEDSALSAEQGILGMNVISHCWEELFRGAGPRRRSFELAVSTKARGEWDKAFAICRKVKQEEAPDGKVGTAGLTWQQPIQIPPQSEMVVWTQVIEHPARTEYCALVEAIGEDAEWQVARTPAWVLRGGGRSAGRGPAESGCPTSEEESDYGPSELEEETPGAWDLPPDYFFLFRPIFVLHP